MALATRCPACQTTFRVVADQLKLRQGLVRCGQCRHVFNGIEQMKYLAPATEAATADEKYSDSDLSTEVSSSAETTVTENFTPTSKTHPNPVPSTRLVKNEPATLFDETDVPLTLINTSPATGNSYQEVLPTFLQGTQRSWWITAFLVLGIAITSALLAAQFAYFYRNDIAAALPQTRDLLQSACASLPSSWRCQVAAPQRITQLRIADAEVLEGTPPGHYVLRASLKNTSEKSRAFPALEVTLSNALNSVLVRRVLTPDIYLNTTPNATALLQTGLAPNQELSFNLAFALSAPGNNTARGTGDKVAGYVVDIFYP